MAESMYRAVLRRRPTFAERNNTALMMTTADRFERRLSDMLNSREFQTMGLPLNLLEATKNWSGKKVFFLHIPKTAGTSVRLALIEAIGAPAMEFYDRNPTFESHIRERKDNFWPLWVGHQNISDFPNDLSGITTFRESRSRVLSVYRQRNREAYTNDPHMLDPERIASLARQSLESLSTPFSRWIDSQSNLGALYYLISSGRFGPGSINSSDFERYVKAMNDAMLEANLNESLSRITHAAWVHDEPAILKAISRISGRNVIELPQENLFENRKEFISQILDKDTLAKLNEIQAKESVVYKVAHQHGLVPLLSKSEADDLFEITAKRLGFTFA